MWLWVQLYQQSGLWLTSGFMNHLKEPFSASLGIGPIPLGYVLGFQILDMSGGLELNLQGRWGCHLPPELQFLHSSSKWGTDLCVRVTFGPFVKRILGWGPVCLLWDLSWWLVFALSWVTLSQVVPGWYVAVPSVSGGNRDQEGEVSTAS